MQLKLMASTIPVERIVRRTPPPLKRWGSFTARDLHAGLMLKALDNSMPDDEMFDKFGFSPNTVFSNLHKIELGK